MISRTPSTSGPPATLLPLCDSATRLLRVGNKNKAARPQGSGMENYVDGGLLSKAGSKDRRAISELCRMAAAELKDMVARCVTGHDDINPWLIAALEKIAAGASPDKAFGWGQSRKGPSGGGNKLRDRIIRSTVQERMSQTNEDVTVACHSVSREEGGDIALSGSSISKICKGLNKDDELPFPDDCFPIAKDELLRCLPFKSFPLK